jgi:thioredoxin 1
LSQVTYVTHFDDSNFATEVLASKLPVLVDFFADWCGPCKSLSPIVEELARDFAGRVKIGKVDVDHAVEVPTRYGIHAVPTLILFKDGKEIEKITGYKPKADLRKRIEAMLVP